MKINELFPHKYVTGEDLNDKTVTVTIARVVAERMHPNQASPEVEKYVIYFGETRRGVVLGRPLEMQITRAIAEDDTDHWPGHKVRIYPEPLTVGGIQRTAIRPRVATNGAGE
jgi:hypothetical protein